MANRWANNGNSGWLYFWGLLSQITADGDCSHEIKRCLLLGRKAMTTLDSILKSRDITFPTKVCLVKAIVFPVVMWVCWTARRSNQSILKEISPEYSLEGLMLKLKFQYFGHLMRRNVSLEKAMNFGKIEGRKRRGWQRMRWLDGISDLMYISLNNLQ